MKFLGLVAVCVTALFAIASPASARAEFRCNGVFKGKAYGDVVVPRGAACALVDSTVAGDVRALKNSYFQATNTAVRGDIEGKEAQTIFIEAGSRAASIEAVNAVQFFVFNSTVLEDIEPERTREVVQICGNTLRRGNIEVRRSGPNGTPLNQHPGTDILIGDALTAGCRGNLVKRGDIKVVGNFANIEFVVSGNTIRRGNLEVLKNIGPVQKIVASNVGGNRLVCRSNTIAGVIANTRWDRTLGQCDLTVT
jgi:hypothetical protein